MDIKDNINSSKIKELKENIIDAEYEYFKYIEPIYYEKFLNDTKDLEPNIEHYAYNLYCPNITNNDNDGEIDIMSNFYYKKILLLLHPDKNNNSEDSIKYTSFINKLKKDNKTNDDERTIIFKNLYDSKDNIFDEIKKLYDEHADSISIKMKKRYIDLSERSHWYLWNNPEDLIHQLYGPKKTREELIKMIEEMAKKKDKLLESLDKIKKEDDK